MGKKMRIGHVLRFDRAGGKHASHLHHHCAISRFPTGQPHPPRKREHPHRSNHPESIALLTHRATLCPSGPSDLSP